MTEVEWFLSLIAAIIGGVSGKHGWDVWRGNGRAKDTDRIVKALEDHTDKEAAQANKIVEAIQKEGSETRTVLRGHTEALSNLRVEVAKRGG